MGIGGSIFLLALGAILAFAVDAQFSGIDISVVGYVLMAAGLVGLIITIWFWNSRRAPAATVVDERPVVRNDGQVVEEHRTVRRQDPPPPTYGG